MAAYEETGRCIVGPGFDARKQKERGFFELAQRFRDCKDSEEVKHLGDELGHFIFGQIATGTKV